MHTLAVICMIIMLQKLYKWEASAHELDLHNTRKVLVQDLFQLSQCSSSHKVYVTIKSGPGSCRCATTCSARDLLIMLLVCWQPY